MAEFELLPGDQLGVSFPYEKEIVKSIKKLPGRRWNPEAERWEVPLDQLPELLAIFNLDQSGLPSPVRKAFETYDPTAIRLRIDNTTTTLQGTDLPLEALDEVTSFWIDGAEYSQLFRDGKWDGYRHLMSQRKPLRFPTGLLARVQTVLAKTQRQVKCQDLRTVPVGGSPYPLHGPPLRDYQEHVLEQTNHHERGILQLTTGAGKTLLAAHIIAAKAVPAIFFVHTKDLLYQTREVFQQVLHQEIGQIGDGLVEIRPLTVATIQTAARSMQLKFKKTNSADDVPFWTDDAMESLSMKDWEVVNQCLSDCRLAFFDECHHLPADTFYTIAQKLHNTYYRYGLSATPWRADRSDLMIEAALGAKLCVVSSSDLIRKNFLVPPRITMYEVYPPQGRLPRQFAQVYQRMVVENPERNEIVAKVASHSAQRQRPTLILVNQIQHGRKLEEMIPGSTFINGSDSSDVRNRAIESLRTGRSLVLIATTLADEGLDIPALEVLILAGAGKSETRALQRVGRVLRTSPGKQQATVVDFYDHARYLEDHSKQRYRIYETEPAFEVDIRPPHSPKRSCPPPPPSPQKM